MKEEVRKNSEQRLYIIPHGEGYSCLGFDVCEARRARLSAELARIGLEHPAGAEVGSLDNYRAYEECCDIAWKHYRETGYRCSCELHPKLVGLEGRRVELTFADGTRERCEVGRSTGWIPVHLALRNQTSRGGEPIGASVEITNVKIIP